MPVARITYLPVLIRADDPQLSPAHLTDQFLGDLAVGYTPGPPYGRHLLTWQDLGRSSISRRELRKAAAAHLYAVLERVGVHGQPPALMLSLDGLESSALLAHVFWEDLAGAVPGDLVVGVPARDVVILTGSFSGSGLRKVRRAVDRVFFAGGPHLLSQDLLVRRRRRWEVFVPEAAPPPPGSPMVPRPRMPLSNGSAR